MEYRRLPLTGLCNARELGGWNTPWGITRYGVFLRTEVPSQITVEDIAFLRDYGLVMDIDLRGQEELAVMPDLLREEPWLEYVHLSMFDAHAARGAGLGKRSEESDFTWGAQYISMTENHRDWVRSVLETLARAKGTAMFHCTTGKDRTGIVSALLLGLCGVSREDILADYCVSEVYLEWIYRRMRQRMPRENQQAAQAFFRTAPENMETLLAHWDMQYGGVTGYLKSCGVEESCMETLRLRLLGTK